MAAEQASEQSSVITEISRIAGLIETGLIRAGEEADDLAQRNPDNFDVHLLRGFVYHRQRNAERAIEALTVAHRLNPNHFQVHYNLGICYRHKGELELALRHFQQASRLAPKGALQSLLMVGLYTHRIGQADEAVSIFRRILKAEPANERAAFALMLALRDVGSHVLADRVARRLSGILAINMEARYRLLRLCQQHDFHGWLELDDKVLMKGHIAALRAAKGPDAFPHAPATFVMPGDYEAFLRAHAERPRTWITKPHNLHNGHGLRLFDDPGDAPRSEGWLVQEYLRNPFLFRGRKVSFRIMILVTSLAPLRAYLFDGGSCRFALLPYDGDGRETWGRLPMHVGHRGIFSNQTALLEETARATGNDHHVWSWSVMRDYIVSAGHDPDALWKRLHRLAHDVAALIAQSGISEWRSEMPNRFAYPPKLLGIDILLDDTMKPWLLEIERGPDFNRLFDGQRRDNPELPSLMRLYAFPLLREGEGDPSADDRERRVGELAARAAELELQRRGRFIPLHKVDGHG